MTINRKLKKNKLIDLSGNICSSIILSHYKMRVNQRNPHLKSNQRKKATLITTLTNSSDLKTNYLDYTVRTLLI